jgi:hypothetical protein
VILRLTTEELLKTNVAIDHSVFCCQVDMGRNQT